MVDPADEALADLPADAARVVRPRRGSSPAAVPSDIQVPSPRSMDPDEDAESAQMLGELHEE